MSELSDTFKPFPCLSNLISAFSDRGCERILIKCLADNDNSKNQVYFGSGFEALNSFPNLTIESSISGSHQKPIFKASVNFSWIDSSGQVCLAPRSQLILYPQYPEVRFSGFLKGCPKAPCFLMSQRIAGRILFLGIRQDGLIYGHVASPQSDLASEIQKTKGLTEIGVFNEIHIQSLKTKTDSQTTLLYELKRINSLGWITAKRLDGEGNILPCKATNCGGYTLEAELGITPNGYSEPDYLGWEIKQHKVTAFDKYETGVITLMTPEPTGGYYKQQGVIPFVKKYGYPDKQGKKDRLNFGGIHVFNSCHNTTNLTLILNGYDTVSSKITDSKGSVALIDKKDNIAAEWHFSDLMKHWNRKHNLAAYIPSKLDKDNEELQYYYGNLIRLCRGTDFIKLLNSFAAGDVYYDPGIKVENASTKSPKSKRRSQFRIKSKNVYSLYNDKEVINLLSLK